MIIFESLLFIFNKKNKNKINYALPSNIHIFLTNIEIFFNIKYIIYDFIIILLFIF